MRHVDYIQNDWHGEAQLLTGRITLRDGAAASRPALIVEGFAMGERGDQVVQILFTHMAHLREELYTQGLEERDYAKRCEMLTATVPYVLERMGERFGNAYFLCSSFHTADECPFKDRTSMPMKRMPYVKGTFTLPARPDTSNLREEEL